MTTPPAGAATAVLAKSGEALKAGPTGLVVILLLCVATYFLFKSMSRHLRKIRDDYPTGFPDESGQPTQPEPPTRPQRPVRPQRPARPSRLSRIQSPPVRQQGPSRPEPQQPAGDSDAQP